MSEGPVPKIVVAEKVAIAVYLVGILAASAATYHAGNTGNWKPLSATSIGLGLVILFVKSEQ